MKVKWHRNLDGVRPLVTVPETDVISVYNNENIDNSDNDHKTAFIDLNDNNNTSMNITNSCDDTTTDSMRVRACDSPSPSSASITSKRSDKSKARISTLFGLFRIKDKNISDITSDDCVSNFSELSNTTSASIISSSIIKHKSNYGSRDSIYSGREKIGFEADTRRRRRANSLLAKSSLRRSWLQLNGSNNLPISSGYIITKDRIPFINYSNNLIHISMNRNSYDVGLYSNNNGLQTKSISETISHKISNDDVISEVTNKISVNEVDYQTIDVTDGGLHNDNKQVLNNNVMLFQQTDEQTVINEETNCKTHRKMSEKNNICDEMDNSFVKSLNIENMDLTLNAKIIVDPKNNFNNIKGLQKVKSDKNETNFVTKKDIQTNGICVNHTNHTNVVLESSDHKNTEPIDCVKLDDNVIHTIPPSSDSIINDNQTDSHILTNNCNLISKSNISKELTQNINNNTNNLQIESLVSSDTSISDSIHTSSCNTNNLVKVKVKENQLPESETVYFGTNMVSVMPSATNNSNDNERPIMVTFVDDEPIAKDFVNKENIIKCNSYTKTPIQGILRLRSRDSESLEDNQINNSSVKTSEQINKSQKKVHFAENCVQNHSSSRTRSFVTKPRYNRALGTIRTNL